MHRGTVMTAVALGAVLTLASQHVVAQAQEKRPAYPLGEGPVVVLDLGHNNMDDESFPPILAETLVQEGYVVRELLTGFDEDSLAGVDIVISKNPLPARPEMGVADPFTPTIAFWRLPTDSAFSRDEIEFLHDWVSSGGALLLQLEHMPVAGAVEALASRFGIEVSDGFAVDEKSLEDYPNGRAIPVEEALKLAPQIAEVLEAVPANRGVWNGPNWGIGQAGRVTYRRSDGSLADHPITNGRGPAERLDAVTTSTGAAFRLPPEGESLLTFGSSFISLLPEMTWRFYDTTPRQAIAGWSQAGVVRVGAGRVALLGDAWLLRSALEGDNGGLAPHPQNPQFTLNVVYWLSGLLDGTLAP